MPSPKMTLDELVQIEARVLATGLLERELSRLDLPLPKDSALEIHVTQLLSTNPQILDQAKARVLAMQDAYSESLRAIGLSAPVFIPLNLKLDI